MYEDEEFDQRQLAALLVSKVIYLLSTVPSCVWPLLSLFYFTIFIAYKEKSLQFWFYAHLGCDVIIFLNVCFSFLFFLNNGGKGLIS